MVAVSHLDAQYAKGDEKQAGKYARRVSPRTAMIAGIFPPSTPPLFRQVSICVVSHPSYYNSAESIGILALLCASKIQSFFVLISCWTSPSLSSSRFSDLTERSPHCFNSFSNLWMNIIIGCDKVHPFCGGAFLAAVSVVCLWGTAP